MKAAVYHGTFDLKIEELGIPVPAQGEVLVKVKAVGICGSDIHGYAGKTGRRAPGMVMGHEFCGIAQSGKYAGKKVAVQPIIVCRKCEYCRDGRQSICPSKTFYRGGYGNSRRPC